MQKKQIGFVGIISGAYLVSKIDNGPTIPADTTVAELVGLGYTWEDGFLYTEVNEDSPHQVIHFFVNPEHIDMITSVDFFGGRPPKID